MGKRSNFPRRKHDLYRTPSAALPFLAPHLPTSFRFAEPCADNGSLIDMLRQMGGACCFAGDINPARGDIVRQDALRWFPDFCHWPDLIITNPPWTRRLLHVLIRRFSALAPTWLLFDAAWAFTKQAAPFLPYCRKIVAVGRLRWIPGSPYAGKDDAAWYLFDRHGGGPTVFEGLPS